MSSVVVTIMGLNFHVGCKDGEEEELKSLAQAVNDKYETLHLKASRVNTDLSFAIISMNLADEVRRLKKEIEYFEEQKKQNAECQTEIVALKKSLDDANEKLGNKTKESNDLQNANNALQSRIDAMAEQFDDLSRELQSEKDHRQKTDKDNTDLNAKIANMVKEVKIASDKLEVETSFCNEVQKQNKELQSEIAALQNQIAATKDELSTASAGRQEKEKTNETLHSRIDELTAALQKETARADDAEKRNEALQTELETAKNNLIIENKNQNETNQIIITDIAAICEKIYALANTIKKG